MKQVKPKTTTLQLTVFELTHLRDLFSISLPPTLAQTMSQALAQLEDRSMVEAKLWQKVAAACKSAEIPMDDDAADFICAASAGPPVGVFKLAQEPNEGEEDEEEDGDEEGSVFGVEEEEEPEEEEEQKLPTKKACGSCGRSPRTARCPSACAKKR
jgi:hypothetical protein